MGNAPSRVLHRSPTGHLDISVFRAGYSRADLMGPEHLPEHLLIYPECRKTDSQKICPVRSREGYPAFSLMCRPPNATFCTYLPFTWVQKVMGADVFPMCCQGTLPTFRCLAGRVQGHLVHTWAAQQPPCSYACTQPAASLTRSCILTRWCGFTRTCLLPMDLPSTVQGWPWSLPPGLTLTLVLCLPALLPPSVPAPPLREGVLLFWRMSVTEALEPVLKVYSSTLGYLHLESFWACGRGFWLS